MRYFLLIPLILLAASAARAEEYAEQQYAQPQTYPQQQVTDNYNPAVPAYNQPQYVPAQPQQAAPAAPAHSQPQSGDYGQSVMTDIRQMNF